MFQTLGQLDIGLVGQNLETGVGEPVELLFYSSNDMGMAMPGVEHRDTAGEIDVALALDVPDFAVQRPSGYDRRRVTDPAHDGLPAALENRGVGSF